VIHVKHTRGKKTSTWSWSNEHTTWRAFPREETAAFPNEETVAFPREEAVDTTRPGITAICTTILPLMATYEVQRPEAAEIHNT